MRLPILLAAIAFATPVAATATATAAASWYRVTQGESGTWYVDLNSITQKGAWTSARQMEVAFEPDAESGDKVMWSDSDFDCKARTVRYTKLVALDAKGDVSFSEDMPDGGTIHDIPAGTVVANIADFVCNVDRKNAPRVADPMTDNAPHN